MCFIMFRTPIVRLVWLLHWQKTRLPETSTVYSSRTAPTCCQTSIPQQLVRIVRVLFVFVWFVSFLGTLLAVSVRSSEIMDSIHKFSDTCTAEGPVNDPQCQLHVTMYCNGIQNCQDCWDEDYDTCLQISCPDDRWVLQEYFRTHNHNVCTRTWTVCGCCRIYPLWWRVGAMYPAVKHVRRNSGLCK